VRIPDEGVQNLGSRKHSILGRAVILYSLSMTQKEENKEVLPSTHHSSLPGQALDHTGLLCRRVLHPRS
jgi:hypothetical protein